MFHTVVPHSQKLDTDGSNYFPPAFKTSFVHKKRENGKRAIGNCLRWGFGGQCLAIWQAFGSQASFLYCVFCLFLRPLLHMSWKFVIILDFGDNSQIRKRQSSLAIAWWRKLFRVERKREEGLGNVSGNGIINIKTLCKPSVCLPTIIPSHYLSAAWGGGGS